MSDEISLGDIDTYGLVFELKNRIYSNPSIIEDLQDSLGVENPSKTLDTLKRLHTWNNQETAKSTFEAMEFSKSLKEWILRTYAQ